MGTLIFIEVLGKHGRVEDRHRLELPEGGERKIGRAFDCDLILDDPHVAARHAAIRRDPDGGLSLSDLGSINRLQLAGHRRPLDSLPLAQGSPTELQIGRTRLRIHVGLPALADELPLTRRRPIWPAALLAVMGSVGLLLVVEWLQSTTEFRWAPQLGEAAVAIFLLLLWAAIWSGTGRLFRGQAQFAAHLLIAALALAGSLLLHAAIELIAYSLSLSWLPAFSFAVIWIALAGAALAHLRLIGPGHGRAQAAVVSLIALLGMSPALIRMIWPEPGFEPSHYISVLQPPAVRLVPAQPVDRFLTEIDALRPELERAREALDKVPDEAPSGTPFFD